MNRKKSCFIYGISLLGIVSILSSCISGRIDNNIQAIQHNVATLKNLHNIVPIAILGSGPAGLCAALYGGRAGFEVMVFEGMLPGGLLTQTTLVENWPGQVEILGPDIIKNLKEQAAKWGARFSLDTVERVDFKQWPFKLFTNEGKELNALTVILATGATPRYLGVPGEKEYWGRGVTTCAVCDAPFYKNEEVVVVGGGDSAAEEAMQLAPYAKKITILVRKDQMRASKAMLDRLKEYTQISIHYNVEIKEIQGDEDQVRSIQLYNNKDKSTSSMPVSGVFLAIGHVPNTAFLQNAVALTSDGHIHLAHRTQEASVKGVFSAGDVSDKRYRQAGVSAGHGISAALDATFFLNEIGYNEVVEHALRGEQRLFQHVKETDYVVMEINTPDEFETIVLGSDRPVVVDFYAEWCPTCMQMLSPFASVAQDFEQAVRFVKIDADQADEIMKKYHVQKVPALLVFKEGKIVARFSKAMQKQELIELVEGLL